MKAECVNQQTFQVIDNNQPIGTLDYGTLFSCEVEIKLANTDRYVLKPNGFFGTSTLVTQNDKIMAELRMNMKGQIVISFKGGDEFIFKNTGIFHNKFVIENRDSEKIAQYEPSLNWTKLNYNYTISHNLKSEDHLFVLIGVYASNYYIAAMSGLV